MLTEKLYGEIEWELRKAGIKEEVEDILLAMAEELEDTENPETEKTYHEKVGKVKLEICGTCEEDGSIFVKWFKIGTKEFQIEDYV